MVARNTATYGGWTRQETERGFVALVGDHVRRGAEYVFDNNLLRWDQPLPHIWAVHEMGAVLALGELHECGTLRSITPDRRLSPAFFELALRVAESFLYRSAAHTRNAPVGPIGWSVLSLRLRSENWWEIADRDDMPRLLGQFAVTDDVLDTVAALLWVARGAGRNAE